MLAASTVSGTQTAALVLVDLVAPALVTALHLKWGQRAARPANAS